MSRRFTSRCPPSRSRKRGVCKIVYGNGETQQGTGLGPLHGRLISLLSMPLDTLPWEKMQAIHNLPPLTDEDRESLAEIKELSEGGLRLFELQPMGLLSRRNADPADVVEGLVKVKRLLTDVEVYWLGLLRRPHDASQARCVLRSKKETALRVRRSSISGAHFLNFYLTTLAAMRSATWWDSIIHSMPKEAFIDQEPVNSATDSPVEGESCEPAEEDGSIDDTADDIALDFVVIAGGVEEARKLLADLQSRNLSLDTIEAYLNETWPVDANKALKFTGPTNEQVAMNFVLECGGHGEASACLESWIAKSERNDSTPSR